ncbi:MAG: DUF424 family protein [Desulfurococcales archaeon]|nr:DUF424 family protein [Desulfurococcales archaeon]
MEETREATGKLLRYKVHHIQGHPSMLAVSDEELLGKRFEEGDLVIEVNKELYDGELATEAQVASLMKSYDIVIIVGDRSVGLAKELGLISEESVLRVGGTPHVQIFKFRY